MRLQTKAQRQAAQAAQIETKTQSGYVLETYKGLKLLTSTKDGLFLLQVFADDKAHHELYLRYRTEAEMRAKAEQMKKSYDIRAERKASEPKRVTGAALCAQVIRTELKANFIGIKFSVTSDNFAGGDSVHISWTDGPTTAEVEKFTSKYQYGHFNGMDDMYEYSNNREDIPQAKYVQESRSMSDDTKCNIINELSAEYGDYFNELPEYDRSQKIYRKFHETSFYIPPSAKRTRNASEPTEATTEKGDAHNLEGVNVIEYSEFSVAIVGKGTFEIKDELFKIGAKYNKFLKCGKGYIYPKSKIEILKTELQRIANERKGTTEPPQEIQQEEKKECIYLQLPAPKQEEPTHPDPLHPLNICAPQSTQHKEAKKELQKEVEKMIHFFAETDMKISGEITESTKECAKVQNVDLFRIEEETPKTYNNLEDIEQAVKEGKVISLCNLSNIVNNKINSHV